jgi:plasmid stabilization system protein ParE
MRFRVLIARRAANEIEENYRWLARRSAARARRWRDSLLHAIEDLEQDAGRCPEAPEAEWYPGLRQLLHGKRPHTFRILFEIRATMVVVLRVRHGAQDLLTPNEM